MAPALGFSGGKEGCLASSCSGLGVSGLGRSSDCSWELVLDWFFGLSFGSRIGLLFGVAYWVVAMLPLGLYFRFELWVCLVGLSTKLSRRGVWGWSI